MNGNGKQGCGGVSVLNSFRYNAIHHQVSNVIRVGEKYLNPQATLNMLLCRFWSANRLVEKVKPFV
jgi:hypothetical protein